MFWYIWLAVITLSVISLIIINYRHGWDMPSILFFMLFVVVFAFSMAIMSSTSSPSPEHSTLIETLPIERLNSDNTSKYILIDGEEYSFKAIVKNEYGIEEKKLFTTKHSNTYIKFDSSIERGEPILQIYEPDTTFWYPAAFLNSKGQHNFYVITLPDQDVLELKLNYWEASD